MNETPKSKKSRLKLLLPYFVMLTVMLLCVGITVWALFFRDRVGVLTPDEAYWEREPNAQLYPDSGQNGNTLQYPEGGSAVGIICEKQITINTNQKRVSLMFANPAQSMQDMVVEITIQDTIIAQSGRLEPGYHITSLDLLNSAVLTQGIYEGEVCIYFFDCETGERAKVTTSLPITITVRT